MNASSLKKQFQKELQANPKKAAILGLLALVAVYFWAPLAWKMAGGGKSRKSSKAAVASASDVNEAQPGGDSTFSGASNSPASEKPAIKWSQWIAGMRNDPLTASYPVLKNQHNPFESVERVAEATAALATNAKQTEETVEESVRELSPEALGMKLTSTIVGERRSVAMIDERAYSLGQRVVAYDGYTPIAFQLVEIQPAWVILSRDDQRFALKIKQAGELQVSLEDEPGL